MIVCDRCGHENEAGSRFCSNCGNRLAATDAQPTAATEPSTSAAAAPTNAASTQPPPTAPDPSPSRLPPSIPPPLFPTATPPTGPGRDLPASHPEWRMSSAGPLPDPPRRRRWIWIVLGLLGACVIACVALTIFLSTDRGTRLLEELEAQGTAVQATQQAEQ